MENLPIEEQLQQQSGELNLPLAIGAGLAAAALGAGVWYGLVVVSNSKLGLVAIGVGWLIGRALFWGAGNKGAMVLQITGGVLALLAIVAGEYLILNHFVRASLEDFTGWLTLGQFFELYPQVLAEKGSWFMDVIFYLIAIYEGYIQPQPVDFIPEQEFTPPAE